MFTFSYNGSNDAFVMQIAKIKKEIKSTRTEHKKFTSLKRFAFTRRTVMVQDFYYLNKIR